MRKERVLDIGERKFLEGYRAEDYVRPSVSVDAVLFTVTDEVRDNYRKLSEKELRILLIKRRNHPCKDMWALPGGFVRDDETVEAAAHRELKEETGVECNYLEQLYTFSDPHRDPRTRVMSCAHTALIDAARIELVSGSDAVDAAWFKLTVGDGADRTALRLEYKGTVLKCEIEKGTMPSNGRIVRNEGVAFDHAKMILYALERLRGKLDYTTVAFNLLPEQFTLTQLQQIYEVILGKSLLAPAFRRKIAPLVTETGVYTGEAGHRPSQLFKLRAEKSSG